MAKLCIKPDSTDVTLYVFIQDSTSTTGAGKTGLVYNSSGLACYYVRTRGTATALTLATLAAADSTHSDGGFKEVDGTNMPGIYRLDLSDAIVATGVRSAAVMLKGATGMAPVTLEIDLNPEVNTTHWLGTACATPTVAGLPEVDVTHFVGTAATGAGGRPEVNTSHWAGTAVASAYVQANTVQFAGQTITCAGGVTIPAATLASTTGAVGSVTGAVGSVATGGITAGSFAAGAIDAAAIATGAIDADAIADNAIDAGAIANGAIDAATFAADVDAEAAAWIWNAATASYGTSGSYGEALEAVGAAADPWLTNLPGAYGSGTAGYIIGTNLNATVSSRSSQTSVDTIDDFIDTEVAAILAAVDTEVAAIKAKTDNLPASPAAVGSAMTLANDSITAAAIAEGGANEIADALLDRDMSAGSDSGSATVRTPRQALRFLRNKWGVVGTDLTVCKEDDTATSWTATITTSASAEPIIASDPASS